MTDLTSAARTPVLVTGMHRSGTSWLGSLLGASDAFVNIREPLNVQNRQTIFRATPAYWYTHITETNEADFLPSYDDALVFRLHPLQDVRRMRFGSPRDPIRVPRKWASFLEGRRQGRRLLIKDPFAVFSIDWFSRRLGCRVMATVRHPVAVVSSLKRLDFRFDFNNLLEQPSLMAEQLALYRTDMEALAEAPDDIIGQGSLLWRIIYDVIERDQSGPNPPVVVRHEDLSLDPVEQCRPLYELLGLDLTPKARSMIEASAEDSNPAEVSRRDPFATRLNSRANLVNWRHRLDADEVERIIEVTEPVLSRFYPEGLAAVGANRH